MANPYSRTLPRPLGASSCGPVPAGLAFPPPAAPRRVLSFGSLGRPGPASPDKVGRCGFPLPISQDGAGPTARTPTGGSPSQSSDESVEETASALPMRRHWHGGFGFNLPADMPLATPKRLAPRVM